MRMKRGGANFLRPDDTVLKDNSAFYCQVWKLGKFPCAEFTFVRHSSVKMKMQQCHNPEIMQSRLQKLKWVQLNIKLFKIFTPVTPLTPKLSLS